MTTVWLLLLWTMKLNVVKIREYDKLVSTTWYMYTEVWLKFIGKLKYHWKITIVDGETSKLSHLTTDDTDVIQYWCWQWGGNNEKNTLLVDALTTFRMYLSAMQASLVSAMPGVFWGWNDPTTTPNPTLSKNFQPLHRAQASKPLNQLWSVTPLWRSFRKGP